MYLLFDSEKYYFINTMKLVRRNKESGWSAPNDVWRCCMCNQWQFYQSVTMWLVGFNIQLWLEYNIVEQHNVLIMTDCLRDWHFTLRTLSCDQSDLTSIPLCHTSTDLITIQVTQTDALACKMISMHLFLESKLSCSKNVYIRTILNTPSFYVLI